MDLLVNVTELGRSKEVFTNVYWTRLPMMDTGNVTSVMWDEYEDYLNDYE